MRRAIVIGGSGLIGRAVARRLHAVGWTVHLVARRAERVPADLSGDGLRFYALDRSDQAALVRLVGDGADLLVDCACFTAAHARGLIPVLPGIGSTVMISSKAVYVDDYGRHVNSPESPRFDQPITEARSTQSPSMSDDFDSPAAYGACKVAAEQMLLDDGHPVTVLRPSKVHGEGAAKPCEWIFVKRALDGRGPVLLAGQGRGGDHPTAAVNIAALVEVAAARPGRRVLNIGDPDSPNALAIARVVGAYLGHEFREVLLPDDADPRLGRHPWDRRPPIRLDMAAARALGYQPAGDYAATVHDELAWLLTIARRHGGGYRLPVTWDNAYFDRMLDYAEEDRYLTHSGR